MAAIPAAALGNSAIALLTRWFNSLQASQQAALNPFPLTYLANLATNYRLSRVKMPSMNAAVAAALYHYFKTNVVPSELYLQIGSQANLAYFFGISQGTVSRHWNSLEVWLTSDIFSNLKI